MDTTTDTLANCPFCGGPASVEEVETGLGHGGVSFSAGCDSTDEAACMGYQSYTVFSTRKEAIAAWNRRAVPSEVAVREALKPFAEAVIDFPNDWPDENTVLCHRFHRITLGDLRRARAAYAALALSSGPGRADEFRQRTIERLQRMAENPNGFGYAEFRQTAIEALKLLTASPSPDMGEGE